MKVKYDKEQDILYISFSDDVVFESDEEKKGIILDYSAKGHIVGIEVLNASIHAGNPAKVEYEFAWNPKPWNPKPETDFPDFRNLPLPDVSTKPKDIFGIFSFLNPLNLIQGQDDVLKFIIHNS